VTALEPASWPSQTLQQQQQQWQWRQQQQQQGSGYKGSLSGSLLLTSVLVLWQLLCDYT
jgi:hypothetical protein